MAMEQTKKERLVQLNRELSKAFSTITYILDALLVKEVKDILKRLFGKKAVSGCLRGWSHRGTVIYFNIDTEKSNKYRLMRLSKREAEKRGYIPLSQIFVNLLYDLDISWYWIMPSHNSECYLTKEDAERLAQELHEIINDKVETEKRKYYHQLQEPTRYA
jgi:hypothetical protein